MLVRYLLMLQHCHHYLLLVELQLQVHVHIFTDDYLLFAGLILLCRWCKQPVRQTAYNKGCLKTTSSTKSRTLALHWLVIFSPRMHLIECFTSQTIRVAVNEGFYVFSHSC